MLCAKCNKNQYKMIEASPVKKPQFTNDLSSNSLIQLHENIDWPKTDFCGFKDD